MDCFRPRCRGCTPDGGSLSDAEPGIASAGGRSWPGRGRRALGAWVLALGLPLLGGWAAGSGWLADVDRRLLNQALAIAPLPPLAPPLLVAIDEASLAEVGRWPWPRQRQAELIRALDGAAVVGYDVGLSDSGRTIEGDAALIEAIAGHGGVVLPVNLARAPWGVIELAPLPAFADAAAAVGHAHWKPEADGVVRSAAWWAGKAPVSWPAFARNVATLAQEGTPPPPRRVDGDGWHEDQVGLVPFARIRPAVVAAADVLAGRVDPALWQGRAVVVGVTAEGTAIHWLVHDGWRLQPMAAVELQARLVAFTAADVLWQRASPLVTGAAVAAITLAIGLAWLGRLRTRRLLLLVVAGPTLLSFGVFLVQGLWLAPTAPLLAGGLLVGQRVVHDWQRRRRQLLVERRRAETILDAIDDAVLTLDGRRHIAFANRAAGRLLGRPASHLVGNDAARFLPAPPGAEATPVAPGWAEPNLLAPPGANGRNGAELVRLPHPEGGERIAQASHYQLPDGHGKGEALVVMTDVTELMRLHKELRELASRDAVTDLPNRQFVTQHLRQAAARADRDGQDLAVLLIDLDHFKEVNDRFGHPTGDALLREVAERLIATCRRDDLVARLGGDEFVVIMAGLKDRHHAAILADKILRAFERPVRALEQVIRVEPSIGISCLGDQPGDADALLGRADLAMYQAKHRGGAFRLFSPELDRAARHELQLRQELRDALADQRFELHYQPRVSLPCGRITGFEALLRFKRPDGTPVPPDQFIPIAENAGLLEPITEWVTTTALASWQRWQRLHPRPLTVAVNVSARHVLQPELVGFIHTVFERTGVPPPALVVEITETMLMQDPLRATTAIEELKRLGVAVSIDDFGTGYSSLAYLRDFPIDEIKIDKSFAARLGGDERDDLLVMAITSMAKSLRLDVVAEGVERPDQADFLGRIGVHEAQGYLYSRPVPAAAIELMLAAGGRLQPGVR
ncbi:MAG: EAL domain-containing protein [Geminicoccaceae bacterium]|nr:MAG: EAL domain-containing protein [Geminicoccaceae bacterium]